MADAPNASDKVDYRSTVFLPRTDFPMKAGLPQKEPLILARWQEQDVYAQVRKSRAGREKFISHDGPPYANGDIHIGHALNKTLKDMVVRTQTLLGKDAPYVPGWDCHGLPIEWKVEEQYRKKKLDKDEVPIREFRAECRAYAQHWVDVQREQMKRLGTLADWDNPYLTMAYESEATIVAELMKFAESGQLYRGAKPVMWSPVEKTALAEAEIEYADIVSTQIDVGFEIEVAPGAHELVGARAVIWTTTPWTIPVNQAIAYGWDVEYCLVEAHGQRFLVARCLSDDFIARAGLSDAGIGGCYKGSQLVGTIARHPMHHLGGFFAEPRPFLRGEFVTTDQGTGLVHMAPDHGEDDFELCRDHGLGPVFAVEGDGKYRADWLWLGGQGSVINPKFNAPDGPICNDLRDAGALVAASADFQHSYPHSWRSKAKVIYRCTPQWFISMDRPLGPPSDQPAGDVDAGEFSVDSLDDALRGRALKAIEDTRWVPAKGENRIRAMVEGRPDWVISRQRAWGVPIALFVERESGKLLVDGAVNQRIIDAIRERGVDAWAPENAGELLGEGRNPDDYEMQTDILDVWFDSGCTHVFTLESGHWPDQRWPADLYLEGSDQHRGWFQSSLLESCGTRGRAPFKAVLTHGFTMDPRGMKMSKSLGNTVNPLDLMRDYGADILRLWALSVDFTEDHRIGKEILAGVADQYRKLRNTFRYLLGALDGFTGEERLADVAAYPELERYMLSLAAELDAKLRQAVEDFDFNSYVRALTDFCNEDLSAFYFDIRKDCLYCDAPGDPKRRAYRSVLDTLFHALVRWLAPVLVFTSEEVWGTRYPDAGSVHLLEWPELPLSRHSRESGNPDSFDTLGPRLRGDDERWTRLRALRTAVTEAIEPLRREKVVGSSLEASVILDVDGSEDYQLATSVDFAELAIVSEVKISKNDGPKTPFEVHALTKARVEVTKTDRHKCGRCWRHLPEVGEDGDLCNRCEDVVNG